MDPLSDVLSLLKPRSLRSGGFTVSGDLAIKFPKHPGIKCYAVVSGICWLRVEGVPEPVHLSTGDCFLLPRGLPFSLATDLDLTPVDISAFLISRPNGSTTAYDGNTTTYNSSSNTDNGDCPDSADSFLVGGHFILSGQHSEILLCVLPPIVHIRKEADRQAIRWSLERMMQELRDPQPGGILVAQQLAYMMLVQALRLHLAEAQKGSVGWLFALADPQMNCAITAMHADPAHRWTLQELAAHAGMSRSIFALKFKAAVGQSPIDYLTRWRMLVAAGKLTDSTEPIAAIAQSLGYDSESAFSKAFRRVMGSSPRQYSRAPNTATPLPSAATPTANPSDRSKPSQAK